MIMPCKDPEKRREYCHNYHLAHKDKINARHKGYYYRYYKTIRLLALHKRYLEHKEEIKEYNRSYRAKNNDKITENRYKYNHSERGREVSLNASRKRRARKSQIFYNEYSKEEFLTQLQEQNYLDFYTNQPLLEDISEDHVIPISKGGPHVLNNIVFTKAGINSRKCNRPVRVFLVDLVESKEITKESAEVKLRYLYRRLNKIQAEPWFHDWFDVDTFDQLIKESIGAQHADTTPRNG